MQLFYMNLDDTLVVGRRRLIRLSDGYHYQYTKDTRLPNGGWYDISIRRDPFQALLEMFDHDAKHALAFVVQLGEP